ncbi:MAG TPA: DoxX family protein [Actinophytocola sp.]|uniref:DoxX family protein n=1 Tax=Actinophytocola sp. TaxID=1872138 RepID=UPI002DB586BA|nr:DoxX family protein [Actinophytocola sp.]HEU5470365.1 DoxX family protein [Actinophytocola sp.]
MILRRVARPLLATIFVWGGVNALRHLEGHIQTAKPFLDETVAKNTDRLPDSVPTEPRTLVQLDALVKIGAGLAFAFGKLPRLSALVLAGTLVPTTLAAHQFWTLEDEGERSAQQVQFLKNLGLFGGLLIASADTEGRPSLGWWARRTATKVGERAQDAAETVADTVSETPRRVRELLPG